MVKINKVLDNVKLSVQYKHYVNNYIIESFKLQDERGHIDEFICKDKNIINILIQRNIIFTAYKHSEYNILVPCCYYGNKASKDINGDPIYILHDNVFAENGYRVAYPY